jgi:hypothetical protein
MLISLYLALSLNGAFQQAVLEATCKEEVEEQTLNEVGQAAILEATTWE